MYKEKFLVSDFPHCAVMYVYFFYNMIVKGIHSSLIWIKVLNFALMTLHIFLFFDYCPAC